MEIKVKYHTNIEPLVQHEKGDWIDLRAAETVRLQAGDCLKINLGVSMQLPDGYEAWIVPRSSTFNNWGILQTNSIGVVDNSYCGDNDIWRLPVLATRDTIIEKNSRICQFRIVKNMGRVDLEKVTFLGNEDRNGFGSTGVM